ALSVMTTSITGLMSSRSQASRELSMASFRSAIGQLLLSNPICWTSSGSVKYSISLGVVTATRSALAAVGLGVPLPFVMVVSSLKSMVFILLWVRGDQRVSANSAEHLQRCDPTRRAPGPALPLRVVLILRRTAIFSPAGLVRCSPLHFPQGRGQPSPSRLVRS